MASKSKKRRKVLGASCILAALIVAGSSFAWFTSKDEVTNRLSAQADYDVKIVESFAPPANWLPGQEVNKDEYAVNTGSIDAFVQQEVSGKLAITTEEKVTGLTIADGVITAGFPTNTLTETLVTLDPNEVYSLEAGSYLAYKPTGSTNELGREIVVYPPTIKYRKIASPVEEIDEAAYKALSDAEKQNYVAFNDNANDFVPTSEGLYVFRRSIDVALDRSEQFEYVGYYYKDGTYYKIDDLAVTPDNVRDLADDGVDTDGILADATFKLVKEVETVATPTLEYDAENNRLIAKYGTAGTTYTSADLAIKASTLDEKDHNLAAARAQLDRAMLELAASNTEVQQHMNEVTQLQDELDAVNARIGELNAALAHITDQITTLSGTGTGSVSKAKDDAETALKVLYGSAYATEGTHYDATTGAILVDETVSPFNVTDYTDHETVTGTTDSKYNALRKAKDALAAAKTAYGDSTFAAYASELHTAFSTTATDYNGVIAELTYTQLTSGSAPSFGTSELHDINTKTVALLKAQEEYDAAKADAESKLADYINKKNTLGAGGTVSTGTKTDTIAGVAITYTTKTVTVAGTGLLGEQQRLQAEKDTLDSDSSTPKGKKQVLEAAIDTALGDAVAAAGSYQATYNTEITQYNAAMTAYTNALNDYNQYLTDYESQNKELVIYVKLADVITTAGEKDKWQLLPTALVDKIDSATNMPGTDGYNDTAVFYYTGILKSGETSSKLVDSVELASTVTQNMYKSFDFDLNMALKSAQVTYAEDGVTIQKTSAVDELDATPTLYEPTNVETAIGWANP